MSNPPSIIEGMSMAEYQARPEVSKHDLDLIRKAPALYKWKKGQPEEEDEAMGLGSLAHLAILEPDQVAGQIITLPEIRPNRPTAKQLAKEEKSEACLKSLAFWNEWDEKAKGKTLVNPEKLEIVEGMHASLMGHDSIRKILGMDGKREVSLFWRMHDVDCRARPDILGDGVIVDLKTTSDCTRDAFMRDIWQQRYHAQAAFYLDGAAALGAKKFIFVAVETKPPFLCAYYYASPTMIDWGRIENLRDLATYKECMSTGIWPGVKCDPNNPIELPAWAS